MGPGARKGAPGESAPGREGGSLRARRLAAAWPALARGLHVAGHQRRAHRPRRRARGAPAAARGGRGSAVAPRALAGRSDGSAAGARSRSVPSLLGDGAWRGERPALARWYYFNSWAGWECGAFPLANDILRISLLSNYSWFRHLEAREQVWKETSHQVSVIKGTGSLFKHWETLKNRLWLEGESGKRVARVPTTERPVCC